MSTQVNLVAKLSTEREGGVKKSKIFVYVDCERPLYLCVHGKLEGFLPNSDIVNCKKQTQC